MAVAEDGTNTVAPDLNLNAIAKKVLHGKVLVFHRSSAAVQVQTQMLGLEATTMNMTEDKQYHSMHPAHLHVRLTDHSNLLVVQDSCLVFCDETGAPEVWFAGVDNQV